MGLKDSLGKGEEQVFTLTPNQVAFMQHINKYLQSQLDAIQQHFAAAYLNQVAVENFGFEQGKDLRFNFDPDKEVDNLGIIEISEP